MTISTSIKKLPTAPASHQVLPGIVSRPLTEDGRPLKCYVGNLSNQCRMYHLREKFSPFGTIINVELKPNIGCGFVEFMDPESCIKACHALDGTELFGQTLRVETQKQVYGIRKTVTEKLEGCFNCGAKNHWAKHCPKMPPPGTPQNVSPPRHHVLSSEAHGHMKSPGHYGLYNYDHPRYYPEDFPYYRQPYSNGYKNPYYCAPRDYAFRDRDIWDLRDFQKFRNYNQWNHPSIEKIPESTAINYKAYVNNESRMNESDQLATSSKVSESSVESKSKLIKSLNEDKGLKNESNNSSQTENSLKRPDRCITSDKKLHNDQDAAPQDSSALAKDETRDQNNESENKKLSLYQPTRKERHSFTYSDSRHYDDYYNHHDYMYPESYDRAYLASKYSNDNLRYDRYANYAGRHAPLRMRSKYPDGYRYYSYSEPYAPYDSNYRSRKSLQHLDYASNSRMDYAPLNYSQGYSRRCSPPLNIYSPTYNYGYPEYP